MTGDPAGMIVGAGARAEIRRGRRRPAGAGRADHARRLAHGHRRRARGRRAGAGADRAVARRPRPDRPRRAAGALRAGVDVGRGGACRARRRAVDRALPRRQRVRRAAVPADRARDAARAPRALGRGAAPTPERRCGWRTRSTSRRSSRSALSTLAHLEAGLRPDRAARGRTRSKGSRWPTPRTRRNLGIYLLARARSRRAGRGPARGGRRGAGRGGRSRARAAGWHEPNVVLFAGDHDRGARADRPRRRRVPRAATARRATPS